MSLLLLDSPTPPVPAPAHPPGALTEDDLLAVVDRVIPESYLQPIKDVGPGYELYQGSAAVMVRCSDAVARLAQDIYIQTSGGGRLATVPVTFVRASAAAGAVKMLAGTVVRASKAGQTYLTAVDAAFGPTDLTTAPVPGIATGFGYEWNIAGPFVDPQGTIWPGELDTIDLPLQDPVFGDPTVQVRNDAPADGLGRPRTLDVLGSERQIPRNPNEPDELYRVRIRRLPDTVTPAAIKRQLANYFRQIPGLFYRHIETWEHRYQECFDAPSGTSSVEPYDPNLFSYDDPRPASPMQNRWLGMNDYLGAFIVEVARPPAISDYGIAYDDPATDEADLQTIVGIRAFSAFDLDALTAPALLPAYDGIDFGVEAFFSQLFDVLDESKAGGVFIAIQIQET